MCVTVIRSNIVTSSATEGRMMTVAGFTASFDDLVTAIINVREPNGNRQAALVPDIAGIIADYLPKSAPLDMFGSEEWNSLFGRVAPASPPSPELIDLLQSPCPFFPGKRIDQSHLLVYIPNHVDGKPLTPNSMEEYAKNPKTGQNLSKYDFVGPQIMNRCGGLEGAPCWVLITRNVIPGSRDKSYKTQQTMVESAAKGEWEVPSLRDVIVCVFAKHAKSGFRMLSDRPQLTYTRCREKIRGNQIVVGGLVSAGLHVYCGNHGNPENGISALQKFYC